MKQYFAYGAFTVCLVNAVIRPDLFSVVLVGIAALLVGVSMFQAETKFEAEIREINQTAEKYYRAEVIKFERELNQLTETMANRLRNLEKRVADFDEFHLSAQKDLSEAKRAIHNFNLQNTFVPRAKRNAGVEL